MKKIKIYADHRENGTRILDILRSKSNDEINVEIIEKQLKVADYLLSKNVAIERKTVDDFLQSIVDGRLFKQINNMKMSYKNPLLIIEGDDDIFESRDIHPNAICGAISSIAVDNCIPMIWTKNQKETANMLYIIAKREQLKMKKDVRIREKVQQRSVNQEQEFIISGLPRISSVLARRLLSYFGSPENIFKASLEELQKVEGIGKDKAEMIRKILSRKYEKNIHD